jgi:long-chain acyl-CoA synthetase
MKALKMVKPTTMLTVPLIIEKVYKGSVLPTIKKSRTLTWMNEHMHGLMCRIIGMKLKATFGGHISFYGIGGAKLDPQAEQFLMDSKLNYAIGYGLTETAPLIAGALPGLTRISSTGPVMDGVEVRLANLNDKGEGELEAKTPCVMQGYYKNPEATAEVFTEDGWFRTRDIAKIDEDGYIYIKGRVNSMIVGPSGENIYPEEIEHVINSNSLVAESIVTMEEGRLIALVSFNREELERRYQDLKDDLSEKMDEVKKEVMQYVNSQVNKFSRISEIEEVEEFLKTPSMKIKRFLYNNRQKQDKK